MHVRASGRGPRLRLTKHAFGNTPIRGAASSGRFTPGFPLCDPVTAYKNGAAAFDIRRTRSIADRLVLQNRRARTQKSLSLGSLARGCLRFNTASSCRSCAPQKVKSQFSRRNTHDSGYQDCSCVGPANNRLQFAEPEERDEYCPGITGWVFPDFKLPPIFGRGGPRANSRVLRWL